MRSLRLKMNDLAGCCWVLYLILYNIHIVLYFSKGNQSIVITCKCLKGLAHGPPISAEEPEFISISEYSVYHTLDW